MPEPHWGAHSAPPGPWLDFGGCFRAGKERYGRGSKVHAEGQREGERKGGGGMIGERKGRGWRSVPRGD